MTVPGRNPGLYGITNSNRRWNELFGKNQFNSAFPVSLACYMRDNGINPVYVYVNDQLGVETREISFDEVFNTTLPNDQLRFDFESHYTPYQRYAYDEIGGIDLVVKHNNEWLRPLEIKLTVLPDLLTSVEAEANWGTEIVIRPATTSYCALGMFDSCQDVVGELRDMFEPVLFDIRDWNNHVEILNKKEDILNVLNQFQRNYCNRQKPFLMQPIWKTDGKNSTLRDNAFDIFIWSDFALCRTFLDRSNADPTIRRTAPSITRHMRGSVRLAKAFYDLSTRGRANIEEIYTKMAFGHQTDKEFSLNGKMTRDYMASPRRVTPALSKEVLTELIINGGEKMLSPERRFDQSIYFTASHLFEEQEEEERGE
ncbi:HindVP family restriction endonuclease [Cohnella panacarvi]|uniref:HindVP family restriction endonuclease n=1 Tax=Cohnella panacarvi TaxID=400776 RepID=UPI000479D693|nr:HindVP family restriction endonuclease [Cohnella panacarvi]